MENYNRFGVMLDCSRNAVMSVKAVEKFASIIGEMGYNSVMLYTEDTYEVDGEPYFGYMRGRYTKEEIKELDAYLKSKKMELIPCIQTLAHFTVPSKMPTYSDIIDVNDILFIGEEKTYAFLDKLFKTVSECFTSKTVNIGMDEAHMVGLGKYLDKHGFENRTELVLKHLNKVCLIAAKYGLKPIMWSDMFFKLAGKGEYYAKDAHISEEVRNLVPETAGLIYWDYYHTDKNMYDSMIKSHKEFGRDLWFAGGAWSWDGFAPLNGFTLATMKPAMQSVRENKIENVIITMWGDNGKECSYFSLLPSLWATANYARGEFDEEKIKGGFKEITGIGYDDFMKLDLPNKRRAEVDNCVVENPCKSLLYSDCFLGMFDNVVSAIEPIEYGKYAEELKKQAANENYGYIFDCLGKLCKVLELKYNLGARTRKAYAENDKTELKILACRDYPETVKRIEKFYESFKYLWFKENKAFGFEIQDIRLGGLKQRINSCKDRLKDYLSGKIESIPELEEKLLSMSENFQNNSYTNIISLSNI